MKRWFSAKSAPPPVLRSEADRQEPYAAIPSLVDALSDDDLTRLNELLPWAAFTLDAHGRRFGRAHSPKKRSTPQMIPDPRIEELDRRYRLADARVLEIGCFEGIDTVALARCGARVLAVDGRIENVVKTAVRCALYRVSAELGIWDVELPAPAGISPQCDVLHHVGVLYHLVDPVAHLSSLLPHVGRALLLDTHVASPDAQLLRYESGGAAFDYQPFREGGRLDPFSGMHEASKWLPEAALLGLLESSGFTIDEVERRAERNGPRVRILAKRQC